MFHNSSEYARKMGKFLLLMHGELMKPESHKSVVLVWRQLRNPHVKLTGSLA